MIINEIENLCYRGNLITNILDIVFFLLQSIARLSSNIIFFRLNPEFTVSIEYFI